MHIFREAYRLGIIYEAVGAHWPRSLMCSDWIPLQASLCRNYHCAIYFERQTEMYCQCQFIQGGVPLPPLEPLQPLLIPANTSCPLAKVTCGGNHSKQENTSLCGNKQHPLPLCLGLQGKWSFFTASVLVRACSQRV